MRLSAGLAGAASAGTVGECGSSAGPEPAGGRSIGRKTGTDCGNAAAGGIESTVRGTCPLSASTCATMLPDDLREGGVAACVRAVRRSEESEELAVAAGGGGGGGGGGGAFFFRAIASR